MIDLLRRSHIAPIIDQWCLISVALAVLRECACKPHWENSFIAVNMHPWHRLPIDEWLCKIKHDVLAADKFEKEVLDLKKLLPKPWTTLPLEKRQEYLRIVGNGSWNLDTVSRLRNAGMALSLVNHMYKIANAERQLDLKHHRQQQHEQQEESQCELLCVYNVCVRIKYCLCVFIYLQVRQLLSTTHQPPRRANAPGHPRRKPPFLKKNYPLVPCFITIPSSKCRE